MAISRRILIVNRHYWPDVVTYAQILRQIAGRWVADGHQVDVLSAHPSYRPEVEQVTPAREIDRGVSITRLTLFPFRKVGLVARLLNSIPFFFGLIGHMVVARLRGRTYDHVLVATNPPILEALLVRVLCILLGGRAIYHLQDIHPEVEISAGVIRAGGILARMLVALDNFTCAGAAACVTLSEDMRRELLGRPGLAKKAPIVQIINNFAFELDGSMKAPPIALARAPDKFRVIFAGNIGFFQGLDEVIMAAHKLSERPEIEFTFVGNGVAVESLREQAGQLLGRSVHFVPFQPMEVAHALVEDADLALISLKPGVVRLAYPSKSMTYAVTGTPILAVAETDSVLACDVTANGLGYVVPQGNIAGLAGAIETAYMARAELRGSRAARRARGDAFYGQPKALDAWSALIADLPLKAK